MQVPKRPRDAPVTRASVEQKLILEITALGIRRVIKVQTSDRRTRPYEFSKTREAERNRITHLLAGALADAGLQADHDPAF